MDKYHPNHPNFNHDDADAMVAEGDRVENNRLWDIWADRRIHGTRGFTDLGLPPVGAAPTVGLGASASPVSPADDTLERFMRRQAVRGMEREERRRETLDETINEALADMIRGRARGDVAVGPARPADGTAPGAHAPLDADQRFIRHEDRIANHADQLRAGTERLDRLDERVGGAERSVADARNRGVSIAVIVAVIAAFVAGVLAYMVSASHTDAQVAVLAAKEANERTMLMANMDSKLALKATSIDMNAADGALQGQVSAQDRRLTTIQHDVESNAAASRRNAQAIKQIGNELNVVSETVHAYTADTTGGHSQLNHRISDLANKVEVDRTERAVTDTEVAAALLVLKGEVNAVRGTR